MIIECTSCGAKYKYDESKLEGTASKKVKCAKCKGIIEIKNPNLHDSGAASKIEPREQRRPTAMDRTFTSAPTSAAEPAAAEEAPAEEPVVQASSPKTTARVKRETLGGPAVAVEVPGKMPENRKISLAVISGNNSGEIFQINKAKMTIGRGDADIVISDLESSRQHARIDVMGDRIIVRDLDSTNGTFVNEQKISASNLENHSEFRIGTTVFMIIITDLD